jgi:hypothetical protein
MGPRRVPTRKHTAQAARARLGGKVSTPAKAEAARANGARGGRPLSAASKDPAALWWTPTLPGCWVAYDPSAEGLVMFPARAGGWSQRVPFEGLVRSLRGAAPWGAVGTGWQPENAVPAAGV